MPRQNRAAQFMPFNALSGLQEALRKKEYEHESLNKIEISDEKISEISDTIKSLSTGNMVQVKFFSSGHYITIKGKFKLNQNEKMIFVDDSKIPLSDIYSIEKLN